MKLKHIKTRSIIIWFNNNKYLIVSLGIIFAIYWLNTMHTNFSDEFDNIVGGWYINHHRLPYVDFFSHHNPAAYYIASLITLFSKQSFVMFRKIWAIVLFTVSFMTFIKIYRNFGEKIGRLYFCYWLLLAVSATYYWGHMLLSETVVGYALMPIYILLVGKELYAKHLELTDFWLLSILSALAILTSFTFILAVGVLLIYACIIFFHRNWLKKEMFKAILILTIPYIGFGLYLLLSKSWAEFYYQSIVYNKLYYIYNFPVVAGKVSTHPIRYVLSIFYNTTNQFFILALQIFNFNFSFPVNITLLLGNFSLLAYFLSKRKIFFTIVLYLFLVYLNSRSEPLSSGETDFHSTVYLMISLFNGILVIYLLVQALNQKISYHFRLLYSGLLLIYGIYFTFTTLFFYRSFAEKTYAKFMGQAPYIYDAPVAAPIINKIVSEDEYFWIGPFEFQELLYINGKLPSKYHWFLPAHAQSEKIKNEITQDLLTNRPKLIVFKEYYQTHGAKPEEYNYPIVNILREHYFRLVDIDPDFKIYKIKNDDLHNFDIATNFYFDKNKKYEIIKLLIDRQIISYVEP